MLENTSVKAQKTQRGNAAMIVLAVVVVAAVGGIAYFTGIIGGKSAEEAAVVAEAPPATESTDTLTETADATPAAESTDEAAAPVEDAPEAETDETAEAAEPVVIKDGNPVVAKVGDKNIQRTDVLAFIQNLSPQMKQLPLEQLFPLAQEQVINAALIEDKMEGADLSNDPLVKQEMQAAKAQIERSVFMQKEADKALTDDVLKSAYEDYKKNFPETEEVKARHILVEDEKLAKDLIKQINDGGDFAALAKENSIDATKEKGGELNYFVKTDVVPEFGDAVFAMNVGDVSKKPVKSDFGYHVIEVLDKRQRQPVSYEEAKPLLAAQLRGQAMNIVVQRWRQESDVEVFDINGEPVKKAEAAPVEAPADTAPAAESSAGE